MNASSEFPPPPDRIRAKVGTKEHGQVSEIHRPRAAGAVQVGLVFGVVDVHAA
jgi:hypothetical protein